MERLCGCLRERLVNSGAQPPEWPSGTALLPSTACGKEISVKPRPADPLPWHRSGSTRSLSVAAAVGLRPREARPRRSGVRSRPPGQPGFRQGVRPGGRPRARHRRPGSRCGSFAPGGAGGLLQRGDVQSGRPRTKPSGSSKSSAVGSRSGCAHTASRPAMPRDVGQPAPDGGGLAQPRGRSSRPTRVAKVRSAGPAGGPAPPDGLGQRGGLRQPVPRPPRRRPSPPSPRRARARSPAGPARPSAAGCPPAGTGRRPDSASLQRLRVGRVDLRHGVAQPAQRPP